MKENATGVRDAVEKPKKKASSLTVGLVAFVVVTLWGLTFVSFSVTANYFTPPQVMFLRCVIAYISLVIIYPHFHRSEGARTEVILFFAGLTGTTLYVMFTNYAYVFTTAPVISVLSSLSPLFTALLVPLFFRGEKIAGRVFVGFVLALVGAAFVSTGGDFSAFAQGGGMLAGAGLAIMSAVCWAVYTNLLRKMGKSKYPQLYVTRRVFLYGIVCDIPFLIFAEQKPWANLLVPEALLNILFLALVAYTFCHVGWGWVTRQKGAVWASQFTYITPIAAMIGSYFILGDMINLPMVLGTVCILVGVMIADGTIIAKITGRTPTRAPQPGGVQRKADVPSAKQLADSPAERRDVNSE